MTFAPVSYSKPVVTGTDEPEVKKPEEVGADRYPATKTRTIEVDYAIHEADGQFKQLLLDMRRKSGLTIAAVAARLGVDRTTIKKYYAGKRGAKRSSTMRWFLRYAEACGCKVYVVFPTKEQARHLSPHDQVSIPPLRGVEDERR